MTVPDCAGFSSLVEFLQGIGARGVEQPVTRASRSRVGDEQRTRDQLREHVDHREFVDRLVGCDRGSCFEREAAGENCQTPQHHTLMLGKQIVAPVKRAAQRLLARKRSAASSGQQSETVT